MNLLKIIIQQRVKILVLMILLIPAYSFTQEIKEFSKINSSTFELSEKSAFLTDYSGKIIGSYQVFIYSDKLRYFTLTTDWGITKIDDALSQVVAIPDKKIFVNFGDHLYSHVVHDVYFKYYNSSGNIIFKSDKIGTAPFAVAVSKEGDFIFAGNNITPNTGNIISLYGNEGEKKWTKSLSAGLVVGTYISEYHDYIAVAQFDSNMNIVFSFFNFKGKLLSQIVDYSTFASLEFLPNKGIVIGDENSFKIYKSPNNPELITSQKLKGNPLGAYGITANPAGKWFLVVTYAAGTGYRLQAFNAEDGILINESLFRGNPYWQAYRFANTNTDGTIEFLKDNALIKLKINN